MTGNEYQLQIEMGNEGKPSLRGCGRAEGGGRRRRATCPVELGTRGPFIIHATSRERVSVRREVTWAAQDYGGEWPIISSLKTCGNTERVQSQTVTCEGSKKLLS